MRISDWSSDVCSSDLSVERGRYFALVDAGQVDRPQVRGAAAALTGTEIHDHAPIGRPARPFVLPAVGQDILAAARRRHDADAEGAAKFGELDPIAPLAPHRSRIAPPAAADPALD